MTPEPMKLLGSTEKKVTKDENGENVPLTEVMLVFCNVYRQKLRVKYFFQINQVVNSYKIHPQIYYFKYIYFYWPNVKPLELEDKINITLFITWNITYKVTYSVKRKDEVFVKVYRFLLEICLNVLTKVCN